MDLPRAARARADIRAFADRLRGNLGPGPAGDAVLKRSFSALVLSIVAASDAKAPLLEDPDRAALVEAAARFVREEPDTRGYDPAVGWVHATAHGADLLKFLARSPRLTADEQRTIAAALLARIDRPGPAFTWGEDERIAGALRSIVVRADFDPAPFDRWMAGLEPAWAALWKAPALDTAAYARLSNAKHVLREPVRLAGDGAGPAIRRARAEHPPAGGAEGAPIGPVVKSAPRSTWRAHPATVSSSSSRSSQS